MGIRFPELRSWDSTAQFSTVFAAAQMQEIQVTHHTLDIRNILSMLALLAEQRKNTHKNLNTVIRATTEEKW
jgi:hypothetical protein